MIASFVRATAFLRRELLEIWRQPKLLLTLVIGPFLILGVFGAGLRDQDPDVTYLVVGPQSGSVRDLADRLVPALPPRLHFEGYVTDRERALDQLRAGDVDLVVSLPPDPVESIMTGRRAVIRVYHDVVDPIETKAVELASQQAGDRINRVLSRGVVEQSQGAVGDAAEQVRRLREALTDLEAALSEPGDAIAAARDAVQREIDALARRLGVDPTLLGRLDDEGAGLTGPLAALGDAAERLGQEADEQIGDELAQLRDAVRQLDEALARYQAVPPEVVVSPFLGVAERVGAGSVGLTAFYAPGVIVVLVQHMLISFLTLSMVREQELGTEDLFRIAPLTAAEILAGKYLAYLVLGMLTTALLVALLVLGLDVPLRGSLLLLAVGAFATFAAAIAVGFGLALIAESNSQAVQFAMLVLLASIFFSGFILSLARFSAPLDVLSRALPATYGVSLFRDVMLRGRAPTMFDLGGLVVFAVVLTAVNWFFLRRRLQPA